MQMRTRNSIVAWAIYNNTLMLLSFLLYISRVPIHLLDMKKVANIFHNQFLSWSTKESKLCDKVWLNNPVLIHFILGCNVFLNIVRHTPDEEHKHKNTHVNGVPLKDPELEEELQFDLPLLKEFLHLSLSLIQLLQDALDVVDGAVVRGLIAGDSRVSAETEGQELLVHTAGIFF